MIEFNINEIPDGKSSRELELTAKQIDLGDYEFRGGFLTVNFEKVHDTIRIDFTVRTELTLICDRSLEPFPYQVDRDYEILYNIGGKENTEDELVAVRSLPVGEIKIDIEKEVRDTILLDIPIKKLHPKFFDQEGNPTDFQKLYGSKNLTDPRWEVLKSLKKEN